MKYSKSLKKTFEKIFYAPGVVGSTVTLRQLRGLLDPIVMMYGIKLTVGSRYDLPKMHKKYPCYVRGYYYYAPKIKPTEKDIFVRVDFQPHIREIKLTKKMCQRLAYLLSSVIQHEFIHLAQFSRKNVAKFEKIIPYTPHKKLTRIHRAQCQYFAEYCEIDAHAHDLAQEIVRYFPGKSVEDIQSNIALYKNKLFSYKQYYNAFRGMEWSEIEKKLWARTKWWHPTASPTVLWA